MTLTEQLLREYSAGWIDCLVFGVFFVIGVSACIAGVAMMEAKS